jgi:hypothetical protein
MDLFFADSVLTGRVEDRIYPVKLPRDCPRPCISIMPFQESSPVNQSGADGIGSTRLQVDIWADIWADISDLKLHLKNKYNGFKQWKGAQPGLFWNPTPGAVFWPCNGNDLFYLTAPGTILGDVQGMFFLQSTTLYQDDIDVFHQVVDFQVWHNDK